MTNKPNPTGAMRFDGGKGRYNHLHPKVLAAIYGVDLLNEPMVQWYYFKQVPKLPEFTQEMFDVLDFGSRKYTTINFKEVHPCVKIIPIESTTGKVYVVHVTNVNGERLDLCQQQNENKLQKSDGELLTLKQLVQKQQSDTLLEMTLNELSIKNTTDNFTQNETLICHLRKRKENALIFKLTKEETVKLWHKKIEKEDLNINYDQIISLNKETNGLKNTDLITKNGTLYLSHKDKLAQSAVEQTSGGIQTTSMEQQLSGVFFVVAAITDLDFLEILSKVIKTFYGTLLSTENLISNVGSLNYAIGMNYSRVFNSWFRHKYVYEGANDAESGLPHIGHIACNELFAYTYFVLDYDGGPCDDRPMLERK